MATVMPITSVFCYSLISENYFHSDSTGSGPGVRVLLFPQANSQLIIGENPSIRQAREDDAKLEKFHRPFLLLRHQPGDAVALRVRTGNRMDLIVAGAEQPVTVPGNDSQAITFQGLLGVLSLRNGTVEHAYALGAGGWSCADFQLTLSAPQPTTLIGVNADTLIVDGGNLSPPRPGDMLRLITADNWVYPYSIAEVQTHGDTWQLRVNEGPALLYDSAAQHLKLTSFPQREHRGSVRIEWISSATQSSEPR